MEISSIVRQNESTVLYKCLTILWQYFHIEMKQIKEKEIEDLTSLLKTKEGIMKQPSLIFMQASLYLDNFFPILVTERMVLSESNERQKELEILQEIITSLSLQLRDRDKENERLRQTLKGKLHELGGDSSHWYLVFIPKAQELEEIQLKRSQEQSIPPIRETSGSTIIQCTLCLVIVIVESPLITDQLKDLAYDKEDSSHPSRLYYRIAN